MIRYTVVWHDGAQDQLARIWMDAADRDDATSRALRRESARSSGENFARRESVTWPGRTPRPARKNRLLDPEAFRQPGKPCEKLS